MISLQQETGVEPSPRSDVASPIMALIFRPGQWTEEKLFFRGDSFFEALWTAIDQAQESIDLETYIFEDDVIGRQTMDHLCQAALRGVRVRILVDGVGSPHWITWVRDSYPVESLNARVYKPIPFPFANFWTFARFSWKHVLRFFSRSNRRNHRKIVIIDDEILFVGSFNISAVHSESASGLRAWRDTGVRLRGDGIEEVRHAFNWAWRRARKPWEPRKPIRIPRRILKRYYFTSLVRLNYLSKLRKHCLKDLIAQIHNAKDRVWLTSPYFVPDRKLIGALHRAARRGVDVKVLVPRENDVLLVRYASTAMYGRLIKKGVQIFEYLPSFLHAKVAIIDQWMTVGSTNLNHRSLLHDLEVDARLSLLPTQHELVRQYLRDLKRSERIPLEKWRARNIVNKVLGRLALLLKYWI